MPTLVDVNDIPRKPFVARSATKELVVGGALGRRSTSISDDEVRTVIKEVIVSCKQLQIAFQVHGIPVRFDYSILEAQIKMQITDSLREACRPVKEGKFKGSLSNEHIMTIANVCYAYLNPLDKHNRIGDNILIWGPCQGTKTMVFVFCFLILPVLERIINGRIAVPVINVPNYTNLQQGMLKELKTLARLYTDVKVIDMDDPNSVVSMNYVKTDILDKLLTENGVKDWDNLVLQRNATNLKSFIEAVGEGKKCVTINFIDEVHFGSKVDSTISKWEKEFSDANKNICIRKIGTTATPGELWGSNWRLIHSWVFESYQGLVRYNNMELQTLSGKPVRAVRLLAIEDVFPKFNDFLNGSTLEDEEEFRRVHTPYANILQKDLTQEQREQVKILHGRYWEEFAKQVFDMYKSLVTKDQPIFFLRPFAKTAPCQKLLNLLMSKMNDKYHVVRFFGTKLDPMFGSAKTEVRTMKEVLLDEFVGKDRFCMVIAAQGRSRMGDSYPRETGNFMDLVEDSCCWDTIIQSTLGRSMGVNKNSTCYFRKSYVDSFNEFIRNGCRDEVKHFNSRTAYQAPDGNLVRRGRPSKHRVLVYPTSPFNR